MHGIYDHTGWYCGLDSDASFKEFQVVLHLKGEGECKMPCGIDVESLKLDACDDSGKQEQDSEDKVVVVTTTKPPQVVEPAAPTDPPTTTTEQPYHEALHEHDEAAKAAAGEDCKDAEVGDRCYVYVMWAKRTGIHDHPEWYPGLTPESDIEKFQLVLNA